MASSVVKQNKMKRMESKKSHSWWWDSHISPKNSKWLQENLEEMDQNVKRMLKLIEEDADSFAKKAELYFKKRPELVSLVEEFYRIYRSLAERYDHVTVELKKNIPSDLRSQGSGVSDVGSEPPSTAPSPEMKPSRTKSGPRAAGFEFFLGSNGSGSDLNSKEGDESSTLDSESESDDSSVNNYSSTQSNGEDQGSRRRIIELEAELQEMKEKLEISKGLKQCSHESFDFGHAKFAEYEEELRVARESMESSKEEIARLKIELQKYEDVLSNGVTEQKDLETLESEQNEVTELQENINGSEVEAGLARNVQRLEKKLRESEEEALSLKRELTSKNSSLQNLQEQLKSANKEVAVWKNKVEREKRDISRLQDRIVRYKTNLSERDQEIRGLKESIGNANKALSEENELLQAEMTRMTKQRAYLEDNLKEFDLRCQSLEEDLRRVKCSKDETEAILGAQIEQLKAQITERDECIKELEKKLHVVLAEMSSKDKHLHELHLQHVELIVSLEEANKSVEELKSRVEELEAEVERKQETILEGEEEKREAIRQLCFSIEHYRSGYQELRKAVVEHRRPTAMAR